MPFDINQITGYLNLALIGLFVLFIVSCAIAFLRGVRRGVWKSTHNMVCMFSLVVIAFVTLDPLCKFVENFDLSMFINGTVYISKVVDGQTLTYYIPITSVKETVTEFIKGFYTIYNVSATASSAANFAFALAESAIKIILFIVDIILIATLGNLFSFITWFAIFQHFIPRIARKAVKIRWLGGIETMVTFVVLTALFFSPLTSLVNSLNQSYQHNQALKNKNQTVLNIGNFVDAYNNSLFAKILFNWTYDPNTGMTIDTKLFSMLTTGVSEDVSISLVSELANVTNLIMVGASGITSSEEAQFTYDATQLLTQEIADSVFDVLANSSLLTTILPLAAEIALNSNVLDGYIPARLIDLSDVDWKNEIGYVKDMVDCLFTSGIMDTLLVKDESGRQTFRSFQGDSVVDFIEDIVYHPDFDNILNVFKSIDQSKVLSRVVPAVVYFLKESDANGTMKQYLPLSWEELNEFSWGYECYVLFDFFHKAITVDKNERQFVKSLLKQFGMYTPKEGEEVKKISAIISEHVDEYSALIVGETDDSGNPLNIDARTGRTIVFNKGQRIEGRNYCLFDMMTIEKILPTVIDGLFELDAFKDYQGEISEEDRSAYHDVVKELKTGTMLANFKKEFHAILDIVGTVAKDATLLDALTNGSGFESLMTEKDNFFSIDKTHIFAFRDAILKMDKSALLYAAVSPMLKLFFKGDTICNTFLDLGMDSEILVEAVEQDNQKPRDERTLFSDIASLLNSWDDLGRVYSITSSADGDGLMKKFKEDETLVDSLVNILSIIQSNPVFNPNPAAGDYFDRNENLYGLLEYVFGMTSDMGLTVSRKTMEEVEDHHPWGGENGEFAAIGTIIKYIARNDVLNASDMFKDGLTRTAIANLRDEGEGKVGLPRLFELIDGSYIFAKSMGPFLDDMFNDSLSGFLVDKNQNVSFENINNWTEEGQKMRKLLDSLYNIVPEDDAKAKDFLSNFDISSLKDIVELNDMLHQLSNSGIFTYIDVENGNTRHYQFGAWFYKKINDAVEKFDVNNVKYDLLADPKPGVDATWSWKESWGVKPGESVENPDPFFLEYQNLYNQEGTLEETHMIAYRDFVYLEGKANTDITIPKDWCDYEVFTEKQATFLAAHQADLTDPEGPYIKEEGNYWGEYYASDTFISDYSDVLDCDEIGRVVKFMTYSLRVLQKRTTGGPGIEGTQVPFNELPIPVIEGLLNSINNTGCLRICLYNFYRIAAENLLNGYSAFDLSSAYNPYIIDAEYPMFDYAQGRPARQEELDKLINFYKVIDKAEKKGIIVSGSFVYSKMNEDGFITDMKGAIKDLNNSYVFHRSGPSKINSKTTFQGLFNSMLLESSIKDVIYLGDKSPKDLNATNYNSKETKIEYLVTTNFLFDQQITDQGLVFEDARNAQFSEIDNLMDCVDAMYSLKNKSGEQISSVNDADMNNPDNIAHIETLFNKLNASNTLYDCLPNSIYNMFQENNTINIESNGQKVDFKRVDPYYHYYFINTVERSTPEYDVKYLQNDINGIIALLSDYQTFNTQLDGKSVSDPAALKIVSGEGGALKDILMDMHNSNLFHTPARSYSGLSPYYTNKFEGTGYTLFEEMMSKICSFVQLDTFAYDDTYQPDHDTYGSAAAKLTAKVKGTTQADDTGVSTNYYHKDLHVAWAEEVDAVVHLAHVSSDLGSGSSLDVSNIKLNELAPEQIRDMLKAVNASDLIADAIPKFVKEGFEDPSVQLGTLTSYNTVNYATYRLGQGVYGGADALASEGTEIDNIYHVMDALYDRISEPHKYTTGINNLTEFVKTPQGVAGLKGVVKYVYKSYILNTNKEMENGYNQYYVVEGQQITAQGAVIVNSLGDSLTSYIARDADKTTDPSTKVEKISRISHLIHLDQYAEAETKTYEVEAEGLINLVKSSDGKINDTTLSAEKIKDADFRETTKPAILDVVASSYNATAELEEANYKRSVIASEFISGVLNNILENEYTKLDNPSNYPGYVYTLFSFGNDVDDGVITVNDYASLSKVEHDGLDGMIDSLQYVTSAEALKSATPETIAALKACFAKMGMTPGNNSKVAQAIYLAEAHSVFKVLGLLPYHGHTFVPVNETINDPDLPNNVYSTSFCFKDYGDAIEEHLTA